MKPPFERLSEKLGFDLKTPVEPEEQCAMPRYFPGDVFKTKAGGIGIITEAKVIINGGVIDWYNPGDMPAKIDHGWIPSYAASALPGFPRPHKTAWWEADEWEAILLSPLHKVLEKSNP